MNHLSTGTGLALLAGAIVSFPFINNLASNANASAVTAAAAAVSTAATGQTGPTIVWYSGTAASDRIGVLYRAWSDGKVEIRGWWWPQIDHCNNNGSTAACRTPWIVINDPAQGLTYRSDINFDEKVDGADLGQLLADWGDAPRQDIPPSDCPLTLINP